MGRPTGKGFRRCGTMGMEPQAQESLVLDRGTAGMSHNDSNPHATKFLSMGK